MKRSGIIIKKNKVYNAMDAVIDGYVHNGGGIRKTYQCGDAKYGYFVCQTHGQQDFQILSYEQSKEINVWAKSGFVGDFTPGVASRAVELINWRPGVCEECALWILNNGPVFHWVQLDTPPGLPHCHWIPACKARRGVQLPRDQHLCGPSIKAVEWMPTAVIPDFTD